MSHDSCHVTHTMPVVNTRNKTQWNNGSDFSGKSKRLSQISVFFRQVLINFQTSEMYTGKCHVHSSYKMLALHVPLVRSSLCSGMYLFVVACIMASLLVGNSLPLRSGFCIGVLVRNELCNCFVEACVTASPGHSRACIGPAVC